MLLKNCQLQVVFSQILQGSYPDISSPSGWTRHGANFTTFTAAEEPLRTYTGSGGGLASMLFEYQTQVGYSWSPQVQTRFLPGVLPPKEWAC